MSLKEYAAEGGTALDETPESLDRFAHIELGLIVSSRTNPRKNFDQAKLQELADSIRSLGVNTPIVVRPLPADRLEETSHTKGARPAYEIVTGERRFRASQMAGIDDMPAWVRHLSDAEAMEVQLVENMHRKDLSALEEAEGFDHLMRHTGLNAEQVGAKIGMSKSHVYSQLKLLDLAQAPRKALADGKLDPSKALLIARIPNEGLQEKALADVTRTDYYGKSMSEKQAREHIHDNFMLNLSKAKFKITDASLVPSAGSCRECPKRTGYAPDLFADVKGADVCTDPTCYRQKEEAHAASIVQEAKAKGQTVIAGKAAQELVTSGYNAKLKGYRRLDVADDSPTGQPLRKIIGAQMKAEGIHPVMIESHLKKGDLVAALPNEVVLRLLKAVEGQAEATKTVSKEVREFTEDKKAKAKAKATEQHEKDWRVQLLTRTWDMLKDGSTAAFTLEVHRHLVVREVSSLRTDDADALCTLLGLGKVSTYSALIDFAKTTTSPDLLMLLVTMQRDAGPHDCTYVDGERVENVGLNLVAGIVFGQRFATVVSDVKAQSYDKFFPKVKAAKSDVPLPPAARPQEGPGGVKKSKAAARPTLKPRMSAEEAASGIANAMRGIEASAPADAQPAEAWAFPGTFAQDTPPAVDPALQKAIDLVKAEQKVNVRMLKAAFGIGTKAALEMMAALEKAGAVSKVADEFPFARKVLVAA
ncbi:hypothetical protein RD110_18760 [Rhodoferax koreense]|uniref:ParB-like N-terminal domain-containing protein n=1 Tax=Rhodoferax koreensis TaxID=1842727 RepID=A0A1P8JZ13_9BURK|nr:ParB/RepB/Spo0J family partition protein [Rhodoferax koreense]APW38996.1 hypothetical protein RD110_18760 [Rhodoferax koreense]